MESNKEKIDLLKHKPKRMQPTIKDPNRICQVCNSNYIAKAPLQKTCCLECRKTLWENNSKTFRGRNPEACITYNKTRLEKDPEYWKRKTRSERIEIIDSLGGKCIVCGVTNTNWLHVDYIPTMKGTGLRHPRHKKWVLDNKDDFRILCANHHYELTITGQIENTDIKQ